MKLPFRSLKQLRIIVQVCFASQGRQQTVPPFTRRIFRLLLTIHGNAHLTRYYDVPVSSTSCNFCPKSITRSNIHLSVREQPPPPLFHARNDPRRESSRARVRDTYIIRCATENSRLPDISRQKRKREVRACLA